MLLVSPVLKALHGYTRRGRTKEVPSGYEKKHTRLKAVSNLTIPHGYLVPAFYEGWPMLLLTEQGYKSRVMNDIHMTERSRSIHKTRLEKSA